MHTPQFIYLAITFISLGLAWEQHGTPKKGDNNVWVNVIATGIAMSLLYWGGFFSQVNIIKDNSNDWSSYNEFCQKYGYDKAIIKQGDGFVACGYKYEAPEQKFIPIKLK